MEIRITILDYDTKIKKMFNILNTEKKSSSIGYNPPYYLIIKNNNGNYEYQLDTWNFFLQIPNNKETINFVHDIFEPIKTYYFNISIEDADYIFQKKIINTQQLQIRKPIDKVALSYGNISKTDFEYRFDNNASWIFIDVYKDYNLPIWSYCNNKIQESFCKKLSIIKRILLQHPNYFFDIIDHVLLYLKEN